ncbi:ubiquitin-protein ligase ASR1 Ecym_5445 [Eremothecium cymbalariae DBVPG|uniref:RING-type domain-containing protein n=1 Tax=Eremothecium cymbalariae (strain CBS 270.75 / DBVPG 7215 / KCTC 17166 / NRRL Y-17582) TaxID=931890 RepID=I6NDQ4_ERECY|nr:hypothetical protein Ecym_5445 [Eremothecium cymbalariae DBVPG\
MTGQVSKECPICWDSMADNVAKLIPCQHEFHLSCIRKWYHSRISDRTCPNCRVEIRELIDMDHNVNINLTLQLDLIFDGLVDNIGAQLMNMNIRDEQKIYQEQNIVLESETQEVRLMLIQCHICGDSDAEVDRCCKHCQNMYHAGCLRQLSAEVNDNTESSGGHCAYCHEQLIPLNIGTRTRIWNPVDTDIYRGMIRNRNSILTEILYESSQSAAVGSSDINQTCNLEMNDIDHSWDCMERNRKRKEIAYQEKCQIQRHVRGILDDYYYGCRKITREQYTEINRRVSRELYDLSGGIYQNLNMDYDEQARRLIIKEVEKLT